MRFKCIGVLLFGVFCLLVLCTSSFVLASSKESVQEPQQKCIYGAIEIGAKGVKPVKIDGCVMKIIKDEKFKPMDTDPCNPAGMADTEKAIESAYAGMKAEIPEDMIFIVGSSGFAACPTKDAIKDMVQHKTGKLMEFIDVKKETQFALDYSIGLLFEKYKSVRKKQVMWIDIGSGNIKGCYYASDTDVAYFEIPGYGTASFAKSVAEVPEADSAHFKKTAASLNKDKLVPQLQSLFQTSDPERDRIWLAGGIVWAMTTLVRPCDRPDDSKSFKALTAQDIGNFYQIDIGHSLMDSEKNPYLGCINDPQRLAQQKKDIQNVTDRIRPPQLLAGAEILKSLSEELKFESKTLFFAKEALYAWLFGYVKEKIEKEKNQIK